MSLKYTGRMFYNMMHLGEQERGFVSIAPSRACIRINAKVGGNKHLGAGATFSAPTR